MPNQVVQYPVPVVLKKILRDKISGELLVKARDFQRSLYFKEGDLVYARTNVIQERLGEILFRLGKIDRTQFWNIHKLIQGKNEKLGKVLVQRNILNQQDLFSALLTQVRVIAVSTFALDSGEWDFFAKLPKFPDDENFIIELPEIITKGMNKMKNISFFRNKFYYHFPQISPLPRSIQNHLSREEIQFYKLVANFKNLSNEEIISTLQISEEVYWRNIVLLFLLNIVEFTEARMEENLDRRRDEIIEMYENLKAKKINYFELLGLKHDATPEEIKEIYFKFARKYHPDRFIDAPNAEIKEKSNFVFSEINKAYDILSNEEKRRAYIEKRLHAGDKEDALSENLIEKARILYRKARTLYAQKKYWEAISHLDEAVKLDNDKAAYFLLLGLSQMNVSSLRRVAEKNLQKTVELEPWNVEAFAALGLLFLSENQIKRAEGFFRKVLSINPDHALARKKLSEIQGEENKKSLLSRFGKSKK